MGNANIVERAIELEKLAIVEDEKNNYADAYENYKGALDYFMLALNYEKNEESKDVIKSKISKYLGRTEILKEHLTKKRCGSNAVGKDGGGGATGASGEQNLEEDGPGRDSETKKLGTHLMANTNNLERAIEIVKLAIVEDEKHNYADAYTKYQNALDYFMLTLKYEKNEKSKDLIRLKINEYLGRTEILKEHLTKEKRGSNAVGINEDGGATDATARKQNVEDDQDPETKKLRANSMANANNLERAIELVKLAIIEDEKHNYDDAYKKYQNALDYFMLALKYERNEKSKDLIKSKINEYLRRTEVLKEHLMTERHGRNTDGKDGGGGATDAAGRQNHDEDDRDSETKKLEANSMANANNIERAIELVKLAIIEDEKHNYADAYKKYQNALDYFMLALKFEKNEKSKDLIRSKTNGYLRRAEILKEHLTTERRGGNTVGMNRGGSATDATSGKQ